MQEKAQMIKSANLCYLLLGCVYMHTEQQRWLEVHDNYHTSIYVLKEHRMHQESQVQQAV